MGVLSGAGTMGACACCSTWVSTGVGWPATIGLGGSVAGVGAGTVSSSYGVFGASIMVSRNSMKGPWYVSRSIALKSLISEGVNVMVSSLRRTKGLL